MKELTIPERVAIALNPPKDGIYDDLERGVRIELIGGVSWTIRTREACVDNSFNVVWGYFPDYPK